MESKLFEVRDAMTFIPVLGIRFGSNGEAERFLLATCGYGRTNADQHVHVWVCVLTSVSWTCEARDQKSNTLRLAHSHIAEHWDELQSGDVVDCRVLRGESSVPVNPQRLD